MVKKKEMKLWKDITPDMMSEEEEVQSEGSGDSFIRHRPQWRSKRFSRFLTKLDNRFKSKHAKSLAKPRSYGSQSNGRAPSGAPSWILASDSLTTGEKDTENQPPPDDNEIVTRNSNESDESEFGSDSEDE